MALSSSLIGKDCFIDMEENNSISKNMFGKIIGYYKDSSDEYLQVSMNPYGEVIKIRDESKINIL